MKITILAPKQREGRSSTLMATLEGRCTELGWVSRGKGRGEEEKKQGGEEGKRFRVRTNSMSE